MRHTDFAPLYRSTVGFDRLFQLLDGMGAADGDAPSFPPYDIEKLGDNSYRIVMAVAGFGKDELEVESRKTRCRFVATSAKRVKRNNTFIAVSRSAASSAASSLPTTFR